MKKNYPWVFGKTTEDNDVTPEGGEKHFQRCVKMYSRIFNNMMSAPRSTYQGLGIVMIAPSFQPALRHVQI